MFDKDPPGIVSRLTYRVARVKGGSLLIPLISGYPFKVKSIVLDCMLAVRSHRKIEMKKESQDFQSSH